MTFWQLIYTDANFVSHSRIGFYSRFKSDTFWISIRKLLSYFLFILNSVFNRIDLIEMEIMIFMIFIEYIWFRSEKKCWQKKLLLDWGRCLVAWECRWWTKNYWTKKIGCARFLVRGGTNAGCSTRMGWNVRQWTSSPIPAHKPPARTAIFQLPADSWTKRVSLDD